MGNNRVLAPKSKPTIPSRVQYNKQMEDQHHYLYLLDQHLEHLVGRLIVHSLVIKLLHLDLPWDRVLRKWATSSSLKANSNICKLMGQ